jgi:thioredoxin 1
MGAAKTITAEVFKNEVEKGKGVAVVDFGASWCGPCLKLAPAIDRMAAEYAGRALIGKVDVDQEPDLASQFDVLSVPTILFFKDGRKVDQITGAYEQKIRERIESLLK